MLALFYYIYKLVEEVNMEKLYNLEIYYTDIFLGVISYVAVKEVSKEEVANHVNFAKLEENTYRIVEVKK